MADCESGRHAKALQTALARLAGRLERGEYYEAHQMYSTLHHRYVTQKQPELAVALLQDGVQKLSQYKQYVSAADLFTVLVSLHVSEKHSVATEAESITALANGFDGDAAVLKPLAAAIAWAKSTATPAPKKPAPNTAAGATATGGPMTAVQAWHGLSAVANWRAGDYAAAYDHFRLSGVGNMPEFAHMLVEWHSHDGHPAEAAVFILRPLLNFLVCGSLTSAQALFDAYVTRHPLVRAKAPPFELPLLNFAAFLLRTLTREGAGPLFLALRRKYAAHLREDAEYNESLDRIGERFFGIAAPAAPQAPNFGSLFGSLFGGAGAGQAALAGGNTGVNGGKSDDEEELDMD